MLHSPHNQQLTYTPQGLPLDIPTIEPFTEVVIRLTNAAIPTIVTVL